MLAASATCSPVPASTSLDSHATHQRPRICARAHIFKRLRSVIGRFFLAASPVQAVTCVDTLALFTNTIPLTHARSKSLKTLKQN